MAPPINDDLTDAIDLLTSVPSVLKETVSGTTVDATTEAAFEAHTSYQGSAAVWYHIAPPEDYRFAWRITKTGGTAGWLPGADLIRCTTYPPTDADDFDWVDFFGDGTTTPPYQHVINLLAGEHYLIAVNEYNYDPGEFGDFDLDVQAVPGLLYESWEEASIDPIVWERRIQSAQPDDPNTGAWTIETSPVSAGSQSLLVTPTSTRQQLHHHDTAQGGDSSRDYWIAFRFYLPSWADVFASDTQQANLPSITNGNNTSFPHGGSGVIASAWEHYLWALDASSGEYLDLDSNTHAISEGQWYELRTRYRKVSGSEFRVTQILDGVTIVNDVDLGSFGGTITGISWLTASFNGTAGPLIIDPLVWSPDTDPGPLVDDDSIEAPFIASTTSVFAPSLLGVMPFISSTTTVFDPYLSGDMDIPVPFIVPTTVVTPPVLLGALRARVSQLPVEVVYAGDPAARVSQLPVEVVRVGDPVARVSQQVVEVVVQNTREEINLDVIVFRPRGAR